MKNAGITPKWVQVGNETNNGKLCPEGKASVNMKNFAWLINSGYDAVKAVNSSSKVIVHLANCENNSLYRWMAEPIEAKIKQLNALDAARGTYAAISGQKPADKIDLLQKALDGKFVW